MTRGQVEIGVICHDHIIINRSDRKAPFLQCYISFFVFDDLHFGLNFSPNTASFNINIENGRGEALASCLDLAEQLD